MDLKADTAPTTRRRGAELENAILAAAWDVLSEQGYAGFTYEAIAARAGTSRPVLYRRWQRREDLLIATIVWARETSPVEVPDTGSIREDTIRYLRSADAARAWMVALASVRLAEYFRETGTTFSDLRERILPADMRPTLEVIAARAVERGEIPDRPRPARVLSLPFDLLRHEMLMTQRPVADGVITAIVDDIWLPLLRGPACPGG
ncbi:MAG: TetR/AcrR family transcriptional regulator [Microbacterium sp.]|uniref:TetR/AcrR family transcriptional regulator n=1 Tax=Microbacterium sp. TaxID=51671 RepID=UPI0039E3832D